MTKLAVVTATLDWRRAEPCIQSWISHTSRPVELYVVYQGIANVEWEAMSFHTYLLRTREILGVVPAFALGVQKALEDGAEIIACFHDDLEITENRWDETVINLFKACPRAGLCGFGGAKGLGADDLYQSPYNPMQLARQGFRSNMRDAEAHGIRSTVAEPVACLDGFSQIGTRDFWRCLSHSSKEPRASYRESEVVALEGKNLFDVMAAWGIVHHYYDGCLGSFAKRLGYMVWYLPIACIHYGGRTAVGDPRYAEWALQQTPEGDAGFWKRAHEIGYNEFRNELPIRT